MKQVRIGINGFGRIGRTFFRLLKSHPHLRVTAINDPADAPTLAHLLKYDSIHGIYAHPITQTQSGWELEGQEIALLRESNPSEIPWADYGVDIVLEASGRFKTRATLENQLRNGAKKVILSAPPEDESIKMVVYGVNHDSIRADDQLLSNASCTTNNAAPMLQVMQRLCGIRQAYITTVHSYTSDQSLHDMPHRDLRRARAAALSIVPTTTGAAKALTRIFPDLARVIGGCGIRVPVPNGSLTDITMNVVRETSIHEINDTFEQASEQEFKNILFYTKDPIVSIDINNSCYSCTFDSQMTSVIGDMVKIVGWYDNEMGYSSRIIDVINFLINKNYI